MRVRILRTAVAGAALAVTGFVAAAPTSTAAVTAPATDESGWSCNYVYNKARTAVLGSACWKGNRARVCDMEKDGRYVGGLFPVRDVGPVRFIDSNGYGGGCAYRSFNHAVKGAGAYLV